LTETPTERLHGASLIVPEHEYDVFLFQRAIASRR
jgi:hypothetical protein